MESGSRLSAYHHLVVATSATVALCYFGRLVILPALLGVAAALLLAPAVDVLARFRIPRWLSAFFLLFVALFLAYAASHLLYGLLARFFEELPHHAAKFERVFLLLRERIDQVVASTRFFAAPPQPVVHVSQPVDWPKLLLGSANSVGEFLFTSSFVPFIMAEITSPGIRFLLRPMVDESKIGPVEPTHKRSSMFMIMASCAMPFHTDRSPVSFQ